MKRVFTGAKWEPVVGYCRAVKSGNFIAVSGSAPVADDGGVFAPGDAFAQAQRCLQIVVKALRELGAGPEHVVRTRMFVTYIARWQEYGRAHGEFFGAILPATTMVEVRRLIDDRMLVEIEADAVTAK